MNIITVQAGEYKNDPQWLAGYSLGHMTFRKLSE